MALAYAPNQPIGKGATSGNLRFFNPRLAGSGGRAGTIIAGGIAGYRFVKKNYKFFTGLGAVATGAGVREFGRNAPKGSYRKAYLSEKSVYSRKRRSKQFNNGTCCCNTSSKNRRQRRRYY